MAVAVIAAVGLFAIGVKPIIEATPAFAQSNQIHKIAICDPIDGRCAGIYETRSGGIFGLKVFN